MNSKFILFLFYVVTFQISSAQEISISINKSTLDSISVQDVPSNAPGIATAIVHQGKVVYSKYAGFANLSDKTLINQSSLFNIASNGKQFTALAILELIDKKRINLSDDIRIWLPQLFPNISEKITIAHLLTHSSGIRDCYDLWSLKGIIWWENSFNNRDAIRIIAQQNELNFSPGSQYLYSNSNYILLAAIIEKASGISFAQYTNKLFRKLNMKNTFFVDNETKLPKSIAHAYFNFDTWTTFDWKWKVSGDGNLFTTLEDQIQWERLLQGYGKSKVKRKVLEESQKLCSESTIKNYGYGLEFGEFNSKKYTFHEGATGAWKATTLRFNEMNLAFVTLTNSGKTIPAQQTRQLAAKVLKNENVNTFLTKPTSIGPFISDEAILGTYLTENNFAFSFINKEGKIFLQRSGRNDVELERESDNIFHQKYDPDFKQEFIRLNNEKLVVTAYYTNHAPYSLTKTTPINSNFNPKSWNGSYFNTETQTQIKIEYIADDNFKISFLENKPTEGKLISEHQILVDNFLLKKSDNGLLLDGERIKNVSFTKE